MTTFETLPPPVLSSRLVWEALVDVAEMRELGRGARGERRIVPILGGEFRGGPDFPDLHGKVLPGGADRQLVRPDGAKELDALYEMEVADGAVLTIRNRVIIDETGPGPRYALSRIEVSAPEGRWSWLNRRIILGTLQSARLERVAVLIRGYEITSG